MSTADVRALCVERFNNSQTRETIMQGLEAVVARLEVAGVPGDLWVDGSFVTEKIDPEDVDVILMSIAHFYDTASASQRAAMDWLDSNLKATHKVDSYLWLELPATDPQSVERDQDRTYWRGQFGFGREDEPKGVAVVTLSGRTP